MAEETVPPEHYKERLKALGWTQRDFSQWLGIHGSTTGKWWLTMVPLYAIRIIELLEKTSVAAPPRLARGKPGPTEAEARDAMRPAATAVIDEAIRQGWSRAQIAASLRTFADETEGR